MIVQFHMNPSAGIFVVVDLDTQRQASFTGHSLAADPTGREFAYIAEPPHFAPNNLGLAAAV